MPLDDRASHRHDFAIARISVAVFAAIAADALGTAGWHLIPTSSESVAVESFGPSTRIAGARGVWVHYAPALSVDCSPPRACYATTQRIHYDFSCAPRYIVRTERISMDLNGTIVKHEVLEAGAPLAPAYDAAAMWVLNTFCPLPERD